MWPGRLHVVRIPTDSTLAQVLFPLNCISAAEEFIVVVVDGTREAKAPHGIAGRRLHQSSVCVDHRTGDDNLEFIINLLFCCSVETVLAHDPDGVFMCSALLCE